MPTVNPCPQSVQTQTQPTSSKPGSVITPSRTNSFNSVSKQSIASNTTSRVVDNDNSDIRKPAHKVGAMSILKRISTNIKNDITADISRKGGKKNAAISYVKKHAVAMALGGIVGMAVGSSGGPAGTIFGGIGFSLLFALVQDSGKLGNYYKNAKTELLLEQVKNRKPDEHIDTLSSIKKLSFDRTITKEKQAAYPALIADTLKLNQHNNLKEIDLSNNPLVNHRFMTKIISNSLFNDTNFAKGIHFNLHNTAITDPEKLQKEMQEKLGGDFKISEPKKLKASESPAATNEAYRIDICSNPQEPQKSDSIIVSF